MASIKISELNEYTEVQDNDLFPVVDVANGETKKVKATNIGTGGKELIMVGDESVVTKNTKLLIETDTLETLGTEVVNSLDGNETAKAPSVQAVNNKFNGLIKTGYISVQAKRGLANPITAIVPDGYEFLCWLQPASQGSVLTAYIQDTLSPSTNIWFTSGEENVNYNFGCTYLVIKTGMKG